MVPVAPWIHDFLLDRGPMCCFRIECCRYLPGNLLVSPPPLWLPRAHGASVSPDTLSHSGLLSPTPLILPVYVSWSIRSSWPVSIVCTSLLLETGPPLLMGLSFLLGRVCFLLPFLFSSSILGHQISLLQNGNNLGRKNSNKTDSPS